MAAVNALAKAEGEPSFHEVVAQAASETEAAAESAVPGDALIS